jgi:hypothetical protein
MSRYRYPEPEPEEIISFMKDFSIEVFDKKKWIVRPPEYRVEKHIFMKCHYAIRLMGGRYSKHKGWKFSFDPTKKIQKFLGIKTTPPKNINSILDDVIFEFLKDSLDLRPYDEVLVPFWDERLHEEVLQLQTLNVTAFHTGYLSDDINAIELDFEHALIAPAYQSVIAILPTNKQTLEYFDKVIKYVCPGGTGYILCFKDVLENENIRNFVNHYKMSYELIYKQVGDQEYILLIYRNK